MDQAPKSGQSARRRHRRNSGGAAGHSEPDSSSSDPSTPQRRARSAGQDANREIDFRPTQLSFESAFRAREVATPSTEDLAEVAKNLTLVRRNYVPPETSD